MKIQHWIFEYWHGKQLVKYDIIKTHQEYLTALSMNKELYEVVIKLKYYD